MRYLVLSDIHANELALDKVFEDAARWGWDKLVFLGDALGYGQQPEAVVQKLLALKPYVALKGNHEALALALWRGKTPAELGPAMRATVLHAKELSASSRSFVQNWPEQHLDENWGAVHGALRRPWEYLISIPVARANLSYMQRPLYFFGHTHVASAFIHTPAASRPWRSLNFRQAHSQFELPAGSSIFLNPGSVGQPRDGLSLASYAIFDKNSGLIEVFRL